MDKTAVNAKKIDWAAKLTSRKLWCAIAAAVVMVLTAVFGENLTPEMVDIIKTGIGALVAYIFGESAVDIARQLVEKVRAEMLAELEVNAPVIAEDPEKGTEVGTDGRS